MTLFRMIRRRIPQRSHLWFVVLVALSLLLLPTGAAAEPKGSGDWLNPNSPVGAQIAQLYNVIYYIAIGVFIIVEGLLLFATFRYRFRPGSERRVVPQVHGNTTLEITWTAIPALIVAGLFVLTFNVMTSIHNGPANGVTSLNPAHNSHAVASTLVGQAPAGALRVEAIGHQWWWEFRYPELGITTATMMHVPAGRDIEVITSSRDVIHSWWVPQMTGKLDAVPGVRNATWFTTKAEAAGQNNIYHAQCAEFCGDEHAVMQFRVQVDTPADFEVWAANQTKPAPQPDAAQAKQAQQGEQLFISKNCYGCHAIAGHPNKDAALQSDAKIGPNLTHLASRPIFAGGALDTNFDNLARWLRNPEEVKPGNLMASAIKPGTLTEEQVQALTAYLTTLK